MQIYTFRNNGQIHRYKTGDNSLGNSIWEDLGIVVDYNMNWCAVAAETAKVILKLFKSLEVIFLLLFEMVRSHLVYFISCAYTGSP